jgi:hypothetical protein
MLMAKKKVATQNFILPWEIYPFDVMISVGETTERVIARIGRTNYKLNDEEKQHLEMGSNVQGRTVMLRGGQTIIRLKRFNRKPQTVAILVHEVFHAVSFLFDRIGIKHSDGSDEAWSYAIEYLVRRILERLGA